MQTACIHCAGLFLGGNHNSTCRERATSCRSALELKAQRELNRARTANLKQWIESAGVAAAAQSAGKAAGDSPNPSVLPSDPGAGAPT